MTTNPSIFQKALSEGAAYDDQIRDPGTLRAELAVVRAHYNGTRLHRHRLRDAQ